MADPVETPILPDDRPAAQAGSRRVHIRSYGCQMNAHDAERMADVLAREGFTTTDSAEHADLVILNTCHIREKASEKVYSELGRMRVLKEARAAQGQAMQVAVAGCVAQAEGGEILNRAPVVDIVVGPQSYHRLPDLLAEASAPRGLFPRNRVVDTEFPEDDKFRHLPAPGKARLALRGPSAFLTVQEGCDKFCAFCVVPFTRGAEVSRPVEDIVIEARGMVDAGIREIMLLGQNVNAYHGVDAKGRIVGLAGLFERLSDIEGLQRLRYATSHPNDMDEALIRAHADLPKLMPYLHLPVQAGSDRILKAMNRKHDGAAYRDIIARVRAARPDIALSSDFIVGFPGETEADFAETMRLVEDIGFSSAYSFKYSARPGTKAAERTDMISEAVMAERLARLQALLNAQQIAFNRASLGQTVAVLFEKAGRHPGQIAGKSPYLQAVHVTLPEGVTPESLIGRIADVTLTGLGTYSIEGTLAPDQTRQGQGGIAA